MDIFDEGVEVIVGLLSNEETTFSGEHFTLTNARNEPKGPQRPHPPIVIGGGGEKRTLRTVARWANHWNSPPLEPDAWRHKRAVLDGHCADVGRDPSEIMCSMMFRFNPQEPGALVAAIEAAAEAGIDGAIVNLPSPHEPDHVDVVAGIAAGL
jgi:alkanesulfonate monooxygenase SsuD/methylene tetrahydromethanopterin reductase-like flavin-dependent oxidoreductase (luciferase family)